MMNDFDNTPGMEHFLASSVHDMKNSISLLIAGLEKMLAQMEPVGAALYPEVAQLVYESKRLNGNLIQMLTLYKSSSDRYPFDPQYNAVADLLRLVADQNALLLKSRGITLEVDVPPACYWVYDEDLVIGVIGNALNNAIRYTQDRILLRAVERDGFLEWRVEDNGAGYPQTVLDAGVEAMRGVDFQAGSTGLGLHFSAVVAQMHRNRGQKGLIHLENGGTLGGGCFVLRLP